MDLINFDEYSQNLRFYGGTAGRKIGITIGSKKYLIKFPGSGVTKKTKDTNLNYSNSLLCEYIGSHIYNILTIPVHTTLFGARHGRLVTACEDFCSNDETLCEFGKFKITYVPFRNGHYILTSGTDTDLTEIIQTMQHQHSLQNIKEELKRRFWDMFIVDALIGNFDRGNSDWGIVVSENGTRRLSPVYDNGNCFDGTWDDGKISYIMNNTDAFEKETYKEKTGVFTLHDKRINPYQLISSFQYEDCNTSLEWLVPEIGKNIPTIQNLINNTPIVTDMQKKYYCTAIEARYNIVLLPALQLLRGRK